MSKSGKFILHPNRRSRICPVCGKKFDAKNAHISVCRRCEQMLDRHGKNLKGRFG